MNSPNGAAVPLLLILTLGCALVGAAPITAQELRVPAAPEDVSITVTTLAGRGLADLACTVFISLEWNPPADDGGSPILEHEYQIVDQTLYATLANPSVAPWPQVAHIDIPNSGVGGANFTSYTITRYQGGCLSLGTTYYVTLRTVNSVGASSSDGPFAVTTLAPPGAPSLTAAPGNQQIVLNWMAPSDDGGSNILGYQLAVSETNPASGNESWTVLTTVNQLVTSYTHTGLAMGVTRYYRVRAGTSVAPGPWSTIVSATTHTGLPVVTGTAQVGQTLTADTSGIDDADGLGAFSYQWVRVVGGADTDIPGAAGATRVLFIDDLGHALKVRVSWTDGGGNAEALTSAPTAAVIPDAPQVTDVRLSPDNGTLTVTSWTTTAIISPSYQFQIKESSAASWPAETATSRYPNPHVFRGLTNGTGYTVRVRGVHLEDDLSTVFIAGSWSEVTGTPAVPTAVPAAVTAASLEVAPGEDRADVFWTPVVGAEAYEIEWRTTADGDEYDPARSVRRSGRPLRGKLTVSITRLLPDTEHLLRIRAVNSAGEGPWAETTFRTRPADTGGDDGGGGGDGPSKLPAGRAEQSAGGGWRRAGNADLGGAGGRRRGGGHRLRVPDRRGWGVDFDRIGEPHAYDHRTDQRNGLCLSGAGGEPHRPERGFGPGRCHAESGGGSGLCAFRQWDRHHLRLRVRECVPSYDPARALLLRSGGRSD